MTQHTEALNKALEASAGNLAPHQGPLVQLLKTLAQQMDAAGDDPSTRLTAAYLSALKDFQRILAGVKWGEGEDPVAAMKRKRRERVAAASA